jgi:hypothetical protein
MMIVSPVSDLFRLVQFSDLRFKLNRVTKSINWGSEINITQMSGIVEGYYYDTFIRKNPSYPALKDNNRTRA